MRKGRSKRALKALRRKFHLGEFKKSRGGRSKRRLESGSRLPQATGVGLGPLISQGVLSNLPKGQPRRFDIRPSVSHVSET